MTKSKCSKTTIPCLLTAKYESIRNNYIFLNFKKLSKFQRKLMLEDENLNTICGKIKGQASNWN